MEQEFETQVLDIDKKKLIAKLRKLGAEEEKEVFQKRWIFDIDPCEGSKGSWIRLRQAGDKKPTLTYKNKSGIGLNQTKELETGVEDFEKMALLLSQANFAGKYYQENKRITFCLDEIEFTIDTWPMIPTYLEIEAKSEEKVEEGLKLLDLKGNEAGHIGTKMIYKHYGIDLHSIAELRFTD